MQTNYIVSVWYHGIKAPAKNPEKLDFKLSKNVMIPCRCYGFGSKSENFVPSDYRLLPTQPKQYNEKGEVTWEPSSKAYIDNTDNQCFLYSYAELIDAVNGTIQALYKEASLAHPEVKCFLDPPIFHISNTGLGLEFSYILNGTLNGSAAYFGINDKLYHYLGLEYPLSYDDNTFWYGYGYKYGYVAGGYMPYNSMIREEATSDVDFGGTAQIKNTALYTQPINPILRWGDVKSILITSEQLPLAPEFLPCYQDDGILVHNNSNAVIQAYKDAYGMDSPIQSGVFEKNAEKIIEAFYPLTATMGDIRTQVVFTNQDIENGNKIDLIGGSSIRRFDITIKWMDIHNNIYPLYLPYGCSVDVRMVFSHKKVTREQVAAGFNSIMQAITGQKAQEEQQMEERRKKKQRTNEELVPMYGHNMNNYGFINI